MRIDNFLVPTFLIFPAGCAFSGPSVEDGVEVEKAAGISSSAAPSVVLLEEGSHGKNADYRKPVIRETRIFAVWVPEHVDEDLDLKVGSHWVFFRLAQSQWLIAGRPSGDNEPHPILSRNSLDPVEKSELKEAFRRRRWLIPYRVDEKSQGRKIQEEADHGK